MKIISWNVNGIRSMVSKNELPNLFKQKADFYCFQEIKCDEKDFPNEFKNIKGYNIYINSASKKGYSGTAILTNQKPLNVIKKIGFKQFDSEGRIIILEFKTYILANLYIIHGGRKKENLKYKLSFYKYFLNTFLPKYKGKKLILVGDFNIAHKEIDLARPKANMNNIMFTKEEREQIDILNSSYIDTFRVFNSQGDNYTWWPYFANARARNLGWRIDYCFVSKTLLPKLKKSFILKNQLGSDHCPVGIELNIK